MKKYIRGFTFVELIIVLVIVSFVMALGLVRISKAKAGTQVKMQAQMLVSDLKFARSLAIVEGSSSVDFSSSSYYDIKSSSGKLKKRVSYYSGISITYPTGSKVYNFTQSGKTDHGGSFIISKSGANRSYTVTLTQDSGMVVVE